MGKGHRRALNPLHIMLNKNKPTKNPLLLDYPHYP